MGTNTRTQCRGGKETREYRDIRMGIYERWSTGAESGKVGDVSVLQRRRHEYRATKSKRCRYMKVQGHEWEREGMLRDLLSHGDPAA